MKRADYVLTHYSFKPYDAVLVFLISALFVALLVMRYAMAMFSVESSLMLNWLYQVLSGL